MTNKEAWDTLTADLPSPQAWVDLSLYGLISIALERRVWFGNGGREVYPNLFMAFVGPPGKGKSFILTEIRTILKAVKSESRTVVEDGAIAKGSYFNFSPDTSTFEGTLSDMSKLTKMVKVDGKQVMQAPYAVLLSELNSFIRLDHEQITKALLKFYDCEDYEYKPKHGTPDILRKTAMQVIGGATMEFLEEGYKKGIFNDGFTSRFIWSFESKKRNSNFEVSTVSAEQLRCRQSLVDYVYKLLEVSGQCTYDQETADWLQHWFAEIHSPAEDMAPRHLQNYMARKAMHLRKMALCLHFSESLSTKIPLSAFQKALELLERLEANLSAFKIIGRNKLAKHQLDVLEYIRSREGVTFAELLINFMVEIKLEELQETISLFTITGQLVQKGDKYYAQRR